MVVAKLRGQSNLFNTDMETFGFVTELHSPIGYFKSYSSSGWWTHYMVAQSYDLVAHSHCWITVDLLSEDLKVVCCVQKSSILTRAGEQRKRSQSMKSYPSSELRNMCDEHIATEEPPEKEDMLQQMLERRWGPGRHKCMETGFFHMLRCVVKNVLYSLCHSICQWDSAGIRVKEVVCQGWGTSAVAHTVTKSQASGLIMTNFLHFLQTPIQTYFLERVEYLGRSL